MNYSLLIAMIIYLNNLLFRSQMMLGTSLCQFEVYVGQGEMGEGEVGVMSHHSLHGTPVLNDVYRATFSEVYNKVTIRNKSKNIIINPYFFIKKLRNPLTSSNVDHLVHRPVLVMSSSCPWCVQNIIVIKYWPYFYNTSSRVCQLPFSWRFKPQDPSDKHRDQRRDHCILVGINKSQRRRRTMYSVRILANNYSINQNTTSQELHSNYRRYPCFLASVFKTL